MHVVVYLEAHALVMLISDPSLVTDTLTSRNCFMSSNAAGYRATVHKTYVIVKLYL